MVPLGWITCPVQAPSMTISLVIGVNPLQTTLFELGIVSGRVALLLRSAEIQPVFVRFVRMTFVIPPPLLGGKLLQGGFARWRGCTRQGDKRVGGGGRGGSPRW